MQVNRRIRMVLEEINGEDTSGKSQDEIEHVFYGKIADPKQLDELSKQPYVTKILQEQFQCKLEQGDATAGGYTVLRVRRVNREGCVMTRKIFTPGEAGVDENTREINSSLFDFMAETIGVGVAKMRYTIKPDSYPKKLELDVFLDSAGHPTGYAKYDYEVSSQEETPPSLPLTLVNLVHLNPFNCTEQDAAHLKQFMMQQSFRL